MKILSCAVAMLMAAACADAGDGRDAAAIAQGFYDARQSRGAVEIADASAFAGWLSPSLIAQLHRLSHCQVLAAAHEPDEKPPLADGDLFSSLFEGPQSVSAQEAQIDDGTAEVALLMRAADGVDAVEWTDTARLTATQEGWRIDDIVYGGGWDFAAHGTLRQQLAAVRCDGSAP